LQESVQDLSSRFPDLFSMKATEDISRDIELRVAGEESRFVSDHGGFDRLLEDIESARDRIDNYCRISHESGTIRKGISKTYRRGYRHLEAFRESNSKTRFHEYRKSTKYLQHQMELIVPVCPELIGAYAKILDRHAEMLGKFRDLERMTKYIQECLGSGKMVGAGIRLSTCLQNLRKESWREISADAGRVYAEKPGCFTRRFDSYWTVWP
jgi:CHAD domain-containing protein